MSARTFERAMMVKHTCPMLYTKIIQRKLSVWKTYEMCKGRIPNPYKSKFGVIKYEQNKKYDPEIKIYE